ncbi:MAG: ATP-dependent helicase HrpB [Myxococcota bacterium]
MGALPIDAHLDAIVASLRERRAAVIVAEPGAGKTTRVPPVLRDLGNGDVVVLEPRRLAARMAARRVADELGETLGQGVGYTVRFDNKTSAQTRLRFVTEGVFVRRLSEDPLLEGTSVVVFDELHERHLHTDLALALARRAQGQRPLFLVGMSATLDAAPLATFLDAAVHEVPGRVHPVSIDYAPGQEKLERQVSAAVRRTLREVPGGDVLVFLPGAAEIRRAMDACRPNDADVLALHGDLPMEAQDRAVQTGPRRKVILSTNIAESSVTIEGVTAVIDAGLVRRAGVSPWTGLPTLVTVRTSQASAIQRAGRAGRLRPGHCLRLYSEHDFRGRDAHDLPEIARTDLAELVLLLVSLGEDPADFPFFEAPPPSALEAATRLLSHLGAINRRALTDVGRAMVRLPLHPRLARLAVEAKARGVGPRGALVAALAAERELRRERDTDRVGSSDLLARLEDFEAAEAEGLRTSELRARGLDPNAFRAVRQARNQIARSLRVERAPAASLEDEEEALLLSILTGFPDRLGQRRRKNQIVFAEGAAILDESSVVREGELVIATSVMDSRRKGGGGRLIVRSATSVEAEAILELFPDRVVEERSVAYDDELGQVVERAALRYEGVTLDESLRRDPEGPEVSKALAEAAAKRGLEKLFDVDALETFRRRVRFAEAHGLTLGSVDDAALLQALEDLAMGRRTIAELKGLSLIDALRGRLDPKGSARLDEVAPLAIALPRRKRCPITYEEDRDPWIQSRMQDFFGLREGPRIAGGKVPLVLHLLAPNRRAVQVTTDLAGFWERHYPRIRKELKRRYPRHAWPEDPLAP